MTFNLVYTASREFPYGWKLVDGDRVILDSPTGWYRTEAAARRSAEGFQHRVICASVKSAP